jgi:hypothetical protein
MKVLGDSASLSALTPWQRAPEDAAGSQAVADSEAASVSRPAEPARDSAENLLADLSVWGPAQGAIHALLTTAPAPQMAGSGSPTAAQAWADHIVQPLLQSGGIPAGESLGG